MDQNSVSESVPAQILEEFLRDIPPFQQEILEMNERLNKAKIAIREQMLDDQNILAANYGQDDPELMGCVDGVAVPIYGSGLSVVIGCAIKYVPETSQSGLRIKTSRANLKNSPDISIITTALRQYMELQLLSETDIPTILDGSFWSVLMDANKIVTSSANMPTDQHVPGLKECYVGEGCLLRMLENTNIVGMSKRAVSSILSNRTRKEGGCQELLDGFSVPDRLLFSTVLQPDEFSMPLPLIKATTGNFGVERRIDRWERINQIYNDGLQVTYYRPWPHKGAFRIEYHVDRYPNGSTEFAAMLASVKNETRHISIKEPYPQFMVDVMTKTISSISGMYVDSVRTINPNIMNFYRTE